MTSNNLIVRVTLLAAIGLLTVAASLGNISRPAGVSLDVAASAPAAAATNEGTNLSLSYQGSATHEQYCAAGNYMSHYYNYYYGNHDSRAFFYFQRDFKAVCGK